MCSAFKLQQQDSYPTKKIKKPVPLRHQQFLVLYDTKGRIYLEKKPPSGLWAGLWCLPSLEMNACPISFIKEQHHLKGEEPQQLLVFKHRFSHFHLEINALSIKIASLGNRVCESNGLWFKKEQLSSLGLAKPTSLILDKFF
jgi:A/G-specific adenine glycosylase